MTDPDGPMTPPRASEKVMKEAHGAAAPGGLNAENAPPSGVEAATPDAPLTNGGQPLPTSNQEAG